MAAEPPKEDLAAAHEAPQPAPTQPSEPAPPQEEEAPDPDEDDLSDLDDVLDEFAATNLNKPAAPSASGPGRPTAADAASPAAPSGPSTSTGGAGPGGLFADEDEFAKSLQAGMAELLGEFEQNPEMQKQFEELVKELGEGMQQEGAAGGGLAGVAAAEGGVSTAEATRDILAEAPATAAAAAGKTPASGTEASFQETIRATMERMSASNTAAADAASKSAATSGEEDFLAAMLREMEKDGGMGSDEDFSKMLLGMMEQLTNKDILYEPMKELHDKFPAWMAENKEKTKKEDWERYVEQQRLVGEIVGKFEEKGYSDEKTEYREYIVERMQQMQAAGSPPPDLVGDMNAAQEALGDMDAGCPQQ